LVCSRVVTYTFAYAVHLNSYASAVILNNADDTDNADNVN